MHRPAVLPLLLCLATNLAAQTPSPATGNSEATDSSQGGNSSQAAKTAKDDAAKEELFLRVRKAHRPKGPTKPVTAFRCDLLLHVLDKRLKEGGQVDLGVQYLEYEVPKLKRTRTLLRYQQRNAETPIVRGEDKFGEWHLVKGKPEDLTGAETGEDLKAFRQHRNLALQLVRFLSPEDVLRSLANAGPIQEHKLQIKRGKSVHTLAIEGDVKKFPIMQIGGEEVPARLKVYVDKQSARLVAIDVAPLKDGKTDTSLGDRCLLQNLQPRNDMLIPLRLVYWRNIQGKLMIHSEVNLTTIDLRADLKPADFARR